MTATADSSSTRAGARTASLVFTASTDRTARVWSPETGEVLAYLRGHTDTVSSAAFSPDGGTVATAGADAEVRLWDLGRPVLMEGHGDFEPPLQDVAASVTAVDFSPDGERLLTGAQDATARIWDAHSGDEIIDPSGCDAVLEGFSCLAAAVLAGGQVFITDVEFGPDGSSALTAGEDWTARVWDVASGTGLAQMAGHTNRVDGAAFNPDGSRVVTASADGTARIWDAATGAQVLLLQHDAPVTDAVFDPDGERVLTSDGNNTLRLWDAGDGSLVRTFEGAGAVGGISFSPDGSLVAAPADEAAKVFDVETGEQVALLQGHVGLVESASFSADGAFLVTAGLDRTARVWDLDTGAAVLVLRGHDGRGHPRRLQPGRAPDRHRVPGRDRPRVGMRGLCPRRRARRAGAGERDPGADAGRARALPGRLVDELALHREDRDAPHELGRRRGASPAGGGQPSSHCRRLRCAPARRTGTAG